MARRGRIPAKYIQILKFLAPCRGYESGKTIDEIAQALYDGKSDFRTKAITRQLIGAARKAAGVQIFSIKPVGTSQRRYCHLDSVGEYTKAINDFETRIEGEQETEKKLEKSRETVEERRKLEEARKAKAKVQEKQT